MTTQFRLSLSVGTALAVLTIGPALAAGLPTPAQIAALKAAPANPITAKLAIPLRNLKPNIKAETLVRTRGPAACNFNVTPIPIRPRINNCDQVQVYLFRTPGVQPDPAQLKALGAARIDYRPVLPMLQAWVPVSALSKVAALPWVRNIALPHYVQTQYMPPSRLPKSYFSGMQTQGVGIGPGGQTPIQTLAMNAQKFVPAGVAGQGVRVGIISDAAANYPVLAQAGILPANVYFPKDANGNPVYGSGGDEADWMLQVVHQTAPQATLGACPAFATGFDVASCDLLLASPTAKGGFNADIIADDIGYTYPTFFYPLSIGIGYSAVHARYPNVILLSSAGNSRGQGFYQDQWVAAPTPVLGYPAQDFGKSLGGTSDPYDSFTLPAGQTVALVMDSNIDPNFDPNTGSGCVAANPVLALVLTDANGNLVTNTASNCDFMGFYYQNTGSSAVTLKASIVLMSGSASNLAVKLYAAIPGSQSAYSLAYWTTGTAMAGKLDSGSSVIGTGAIDPYDNPGGPDVAEYFSSAGPQLLSWKFDPTTGNYVALAAMTAAEEPQMVAPDGALTAFPSGQAPGYVFFRFFGTSATSEAVAAVGALLMSAGVPQNMIAQAITATATPQAAQASPTKIWDPIYGYGVVNAAAAIQQYGPKPIPVITDPINSSAFVNEKLTFNGYCYMPGINLPGIPDYNWNFGNGNKGTGPLVDNVSYGNPGNYNVSFTCTNALGVTVAKPATKSIQVATAPGGGGGGLGFLGLAGLAGLVLLGLFISRRRGH